MMPAANRPDPELLPIRRPRCPKCQARMMTDAVSDGPEGFERVTFSCPKCAHTEIKILPRDPLSSDAAGWINGELRPPH
jgi:hypothetical protein